MSYNPDSKTTVKHLKDLAVRLKNELEKSTPRKVSDLENDAGYQTAADVAAAIEDREHLTKVIVESVEAINLEADDADRYIYLVPKGTGKNKNKYDEYMVLDGALEPVGDWKVNLSGYVQKEDGKDLSSNDYTSEDKEKLGGIAEGATKVEASETDGAVKINGVEVQVVAIASDAEVAEMLNEVFSADSEAEA